MQASPSLHDCPVIVHPLSISTQRNSKSVHLPLEKAKPSPSGIKSLDAELNSTRMTSPDRKLTLVQTLEYCAYSAIPVPKILGLVNVSLSLWPLMEIL